MIYVTVQAIGSLHLKRRRLVHAALRCFCCSTIQGKNACSSSVLNY